jgi:hypothetical protein
MMTRICDRCGQAILPNQVRYIAKVQVFAAYDPLEITFEDLQRDHRREIDEILRQCETLSEAELMRDVYVEFAFDLCRACQQAYLAAPLQAANRNIS